MDGQSDVWTNRVTCARTDSNPPVLQGRLATANPIQHAQILAIARQAPSRWFGRACPQNKSLPAGAGLTHLERHDLIHHVARGRLVLVVAELEVEKCGRRGIVVRRVIHTHT
eukprot:362730-Chlamydomonas_euryale.AAC.1